MNNDQKIEEILHSMDNMHRAELSPFVSAKLLNKILNAEEYSVSLIGRPVLIISISMLLLLFNVAILFQSNSNQFLVKESSSKYMEELEKEYILNSTTIKYYNEIPR